LLIDALRVARERGDELRHLQQKYLFVVDLAIGQGHELDKVRRQVARLLEEKAARRERSKAIAA